MKERALELCNLLGIQLVSESSAKLDQQDTAESLESTTWSLLSATNNSFCSLEATDEGTS